MSFDTYLQIDPTKGESTDAKHKGWIEVFSFSHGLSQQGSGGVSGGVSRVAGKVDVQDFTITKRLDLASPALSRDCCLGKHYAKAVVEICKSTGEKEVFMKYTFEHVVVSSVTVGGGQGQEHPVETVSFSFGKVSWDYTAQATDKGGKGSNLKTWHDSRENTSG